MRIGPLVDSERRWRGVVRGECARARGQQPGRQGDDAADEGRRRKGAGAAPAPRRTLGQAHHATIHKRKPPPFRKRKKYTFV